MGYFKSWGRPAAEELRATVIGGAIRRGMPTVGRVDVLDGIRGWAAFSVVVFHFTWELFGVIEPAFRNPVTAFFLDGELAVAVFFVLSGAALSVSYFNGGGEAAVLKMAVKRYPRLFIPILAACMIVFALERLGLVYNVSAGAIVQRSDWLGSFQHPALSLYDVLRYSLVDVFWTRGNGDIIPFLWTMKLEFVGSIAVFALLLSVRSLPSYRAVFWSIFAVLAVIPHVGLNQLACFVAGMCLADMRARGRFAHLQTRLPSLLAWMLLVAVAALDASQHLQGSPFFRAFFAVALLMIIFANPRIEAFFANPLSRLLGKLSFSLYLMQYPVMISITSWLIVHFGASGLQNPMVVLTIVMVSVGLCLVAAIAFEPVERFTHFVCRSLVKWVMAIASGAKLARSGA